MKKLLYVMSMISFAACLDSSSPATDDVVLSTTEQKVSICTSSCDPPYNGVPVSCASNSYCISAPEGAYCLQGDGSYIIAACVEPVCGNGVCEGNENQTCPQDCAPPPPPCGDGVCEYDERNWCYDDCGWCLVPDCY